MESFSVPKAASIATILFMFGSVILLAFKLTPAINKELQNESFETLDSHHGCDMIRYMDKFNRWHYFMKCND
jgi:hypothetical protein